MSQSVNQQPQMLPPTVFWRIAEDIPKRLTWTLMTLSIVIPICLWWIVSSWVVSSSGSNSMFLPTPVQVLGAIQKLWSDGTMNPLLL